MITYQLNFNKPPFNDVRVRQAINYAVNRDATIAVIDGFGLPAGQYSNAGEPYYDPDWPGYSYRSGEGEAAPGRRGLRQRFEAAHGVSARWIREHVAGSDERAAEG